jgi:hypothetical protein
LEGEVVHQKKEKYFSLFLFAVFLSAGAYLLQDSVSNADRYSEATALAGALLSAFALAAVSWSIRLHLHAKALRRHLRRG